jgi:hypothetical protein
MKKVVGIISLALCAVFVQPAVAGDEKVIAVIDTAIDSSKNASIAYEVCFTLNTCPNGTSFQEGKGASNVPNWKLKGVDHGFNIVQVINTVSPGTKIVFIRISDFNVYSTFSALHNDGSSLSRAIDWVAKNAGKYGIDAVSISHSRSNFAPGTCPTDNVFESSVKSLNLVNVPTFVATGNDRKKNMIGFPSCVNGVVPVAAIDPTGKISSLSNYSSAVKIVANVCATFSGEICVKTPDYAGVMRAQSGTSISTPLAVAKLINAWSGQNWNELINGLPKNGTAGQIK